MTNQRPRNRLPVLLTPPYRHTHYSDISVVTVDPASVQSRCPILMPVMRPSIRVVGRPACQAGGGPEHYWKNCERLNAAAG